MSCWGHRTGDQVDAVELGHVGLRRVVAVEDDEAVALLPGRHEEEVLGEGQAGEVGGQHEVALGVAQVHGRAVGRGAVHDVAVEVLLGAAVFHLGERPAHEGVGDLLVAVEDGDRARQAVRMPL